MIRSDEEKQRKREEVVAMKELKSYMWSYRKVTPTEDMTMYALKMVGSHVDPNIPAVDPRSTLWRRRNASAFHLEDLTRKWM